MSFFQKIKDAFARWMSGRYGADQLSRAILYASIALLIISMITGIGIFYYLSIAGYAWALFRVMSRNAVARSHENEVYLQKTGNLRKSIHQAFVRFKNRKQYKYFKCPKCGVRLRLTRGCGEKNITCQKCGHQFTMKA